MKKNLDTDIQYVKGVGPARAQVLSGIGISNIRDLLYFVPKGEDRYLVYRGFRSIGDCGEGDDVIVKGTVTGIRTRYTRGRKKIFEVSISDDTGVLLGIWFNVRSYITETFKEGQTVIFRGKVSVYDDMQITHPRFEIVEKDEEPEVDLNIKQGAIVPVYPETGEFHDRIGQNVFRTIIQNAWNEVKDSLADPIPEHIREERELCSIQEMFGFLHFPESRKEVSEGIHRYKYQELFSMELGIARYAFRIREKREKTPVTISEKVDFRIRKRFPFSFTDAQERAVRDIAADMSSEIPMNRLLQGDVGSGKTAVAVYAILAAVAGRRQAAFMAPTSILAEQHYNTVDRLLSGSKVEHRLLSGGMSRAERDSLLDEIGRGNVDLVVGTHALIQEDVVFKDLALVIVDEQHKFGVLQRKDLSEKGYNPDILVMTATPIPRTLSMTAYGEYDISVIDEMPPGRTPVKTYWFSEKKRDLGYDIIRERAAKGEQVFVICPLVEESEDSDLKSAVETHVKLGTRVFPELNVGLVHGKLRQDEKDSIMQRFRQGEIDILVATVVVEVGVDIPNASIMVIEHAERFGLSQLHQLRGRIGRGARSPVCILFASRPTQAALERIKIITKTNDGFKIAEKDFELRGPGEYFGTRQHGMPSFYLADLSADRLLLYAARQDAFGIIADDPDLKKPENRYCEDLMKRRFSYGVELLGVT